MQAELTMSNHRFILLCFTFTSRRRWKHYFLPLVVICWALLIKLNLSPGKIWKTLTEMWSAPSVGVWSEQDSFLL